MYIYLVRHAEAVSKDVDPMRPLSKRGVEQAKKTGRFLKNMGIGVSSILHSGKKRAEETASLIASEIKHSFPLEKREGLSPDDPVDGIMRELETRETDCL
ncbi:MAG: histidine phosphatase family protein, partial [Candidatus Aureabacteria bacterium]|nr:histidine phosphatase family protein [Candidatus Auribacterota bacterium]